MIGYFKWLWERRLFWFQRRRRNEPPFRLYVGKRGRGKSLMLTRDVQRELAAGSLVLANYPVYDPLSERCAVEWGSIQQLMEWTAQAVLEDQPRIIIAIDEAQNHFDARDWESCPRWWRQFLAESRHYHVGVLAATQAISQVDKRFRILTDDVIRVRPVIEGLHHKVAVFRLTALEENFDSADEEGRQLGNGRLTYVSARVFGGYSTGALPVEEEVASGDSSAIEALIARTRLHVSTLEPVSDREDENDDAA